MLSGSDELPRTRTPYSLRMGKSSSDPRSVQGLKTALVSEDRPLKILLKKIRCAEKLVCRSML